MTSAFLYRPGETLSLCELQSARLDGDVIEVGDAYMPADAIETAELRAGSLSRSVGTRCALTHESAAWVLGALDDPPTRHSAQRCVPRRVPPMIDRRFQYRDQLLPAADVILVGATAVTTPVRTLVDLLRDRWCQTPTQQHAAVALARWHPDLVAAADTWLRAAGPVPFKRAALTAVEDLRLRMT